MMAFFVLQIAMYYVYILYSSKANKYYVGQTSNPWKRLEQHLDNTGEKFTGSYKDWELRAVFAVSENKGDADKIERFIKQQKSRKLIEKMLELDFKGEVILVFLLQKESGIVLKG
jgi:putative endonuclease